MDDKGSEIADKHRVRSDSDQRLEGGASNRTPTSPRAVRSALNRLIVSGWGEIIAFEAAARVVAAGPRAPLREQVERRRRFQRDLGAAVTALGGAPTTRASLGARIAAGARRLREFFVGPHQGDAYAVCARATARAARAYSKALALELPADVTFGVERQFAEIDWDRRELRRLRWGATPSPRPERRLDERAERRSTEAPNKGDDRRALQVWNDDGGAAAKAAAGYVVPL